MTATSTGGVTPSALPGTQEPPQVRTGLVLLVVSAAVFLASLDLFIVNIAFPAIGADFSADAAGLSWVLNVYTIGFAALLAPADGTPRDCA